MTTVREIIRKAGGPKAIAEASEDTAYPVGIYAVHKWRRRGIPDEHWELLKRLTGVPVATIYKVNLAMKSDGKRRSSSRVAA